MRNIILAATITLCAAVILFFVGAGLGSLLSSLLPGDLAQLPKGLAGIPLGGTKGIYEALEAHSAKRAFAKTKPGQSVHLDEFSIHPLTAFLLCLISWWGVILFTGALMGVIIGVVTDDSILSSNPLLPTLTAFPLRLVAAVYLGCWFGTRSRRYGFGILIGGFILGYSAAFLLSVWMIGNDGFTKLSGENLTTLQRYVELLPDMAIFVVAGVLGCWYGQRQKPAYHLAFVLRMLPQKVGQLIVEMARDEAMRARTSAVKSL
ncbi:hypothetical protein JQ543_27790 [Bradyrhizobium diazoefficiens]|nr:hypothetical protein [Bradyrhizobium diazoefficiens]MBR0851576.1 hypothetical protein [Bradyrhizobium diazoefficiens]